MKGKILLALTFLLIFTKYISAQPFAGGSGTKANPYKISTPAQLDSVRNYLTACFVLINDIDLNIAPYNTGKGWLPIGDMSRPFIGTFNGAGHIIKNLYVNRPREIYAGLFSCTYKSHIDSLGISECDIKANSCGGLSSFSDNDTITNCYVSGKIFGTMSVGGLIGSTTGNSLIQSCYSTCDVTATGALGSLSGICGYSTINNCYATGNVYGGINESTGGLVGSIYGSKINNCYATGNVYGISEVGGFTGYCNQYSTFNNCYSVGLVKANTNFGGFIGYKNNGYINNDYYNTETSGQKDTGKGIPKTTAEMKKQVTFSGWNFTNTWAIRSGYTYPGLRNINNAPFAFRDTLEVSGNTPLKALLNNDYDIEKNQDSLTLKVYNVYGIGTTDTLNYFGFPKGTVTGTTDSLLYRVGEISRKGIIIWGNCATVVLKKVANTAPIIQNRLLTIDEDSIFCVPEISFTAAQSTDPEGDIITIGSILTYPKHGTLSLANHQFSYTPNTNWFGKDTVKYILTDSEFSDTALLAITVNPVNDAPVITSKAPTSFRKGTKYTYTVVATDAESNTLTYTLSNAPAGMVINGNVISWTPAAGVLTSGKVTLTVSDGLLKDTEIFTVLPNEAPKIISDAPSTATEDIAYTYTVTATDNEGDALTYSISNQPANMQINSNVISWVPREGIFTSGEITLTVSDGDLNDTQIFSIKVTPVNDAPIITSAPPSTATNGKLYTYTVTASDTEDSTLTYSISNAPAGMSINNNVINWIPPAGVSSGNATITVSDGSLSAIQTLSISVTPATEIIATRVSSPVFYPNPVDDIMEIHITSLKDPVILIEILSTNGKVVYNQKFQNNQEVYQLNISHLIQGTYLCRIKSGKYIEAFKFIKN